jgi:formylglycine-generating enzyme required for sulfatase activity
VIAVVSALAAVIVVPEVREWLGLDKPLVQRKTSTPVSPPQEITTSIGMELVPIPAGEFQMGSNEGFLDVERPIHRVRISKPFYMGKYEVTQAKTTHRSLLTQTGTDRERTSKRSWPRYLTS